VSAAGASGARAHLVTAAVAAAAAVAVTIPATLGFSHSRASGPPPVVGVIGQPVWHFPWCHPDTTYCPPPGTTAPHLVGRAHP
jgi:hypothetical protein